MDLPFAFEIHLCQQGCHVGICPGSAGLIWSSGAVAVGVGSCAVLSTALQRVLASPASCQALRIHAFQLRLNQLLQDSIPLSSHSNHTHRDMVS